MAESSKTTLYVGLDVHKESITVAYAPEERGAGWWRWADRDAPVRHRQAHSAAPGQGRAAGVRVRGGAVWLLAVSVPHREGLDLPRGGAVADPAQARGPREDRPARCGQPGPAMRSGDLSAIYVPSVADEAVRDVSRGREDALHDLKRSNSG